MFHFARSAIFMLSISALIAAPAAAFTITFDENQNCSGDGCVAAFSGGLDPTGGYNGPVLYYQLSAHVKLGDVNILDQHGIISDMLRFYQVPGFVGNPGDGYAMFYYSYDSTGAIADVGNINIDPTAPIGAIEDASGNFKLTYSDDTFIGVSSVSSDTPEPSSWVLMTLGFVGLGFVAYRNTTMGSRALA